MTAPEADGWDELERLAKAATPGEWAAAGRYVGTVRAGNGYIAECRRFPENAEADVSADNAAFIAAANPSTVLKLIEAARLNRGGDEGRQAGVRQDNAGDNYGFETWLGSDYCAPEQAGEGEAPVAWRTRLGKGDWRVTIEPVKPETVAEYEKRWPGDLEVEPLFTRPTPATPEGPKPTGEQMVCGNDWQRRMLADAPATPEGLREKVVHLRCCMGAALAGMRARPDADRQRNLETVLAEFISKTDAILAALQPNAGTGRGVVSIPGDAGSDGQAAKVSASAGDLT